MRKVFILMLVITLMVVPVPTVEASSYDIRVFVDGKEVVFTDAKPYIDENNRTLVPVRFPAEAVGADVVWKGETKQVIIFKDGKEVVLTAGKREFTVNGQTLQMDTAMVFNTEKGRNFTPIRFILEGLGYEVDWQVVGKNGIIHTFTLEYTNEEKDAIKREIANQIELEQTTTNNVKQVLNTLPKTDLTLNQGLKGNGADVGYSIADVAKFAREYLTLYTNYNGNDVVFMENWAIEINTRFMGESSNAHTIKQQILDKKQVASATSYVDAKNISIENGKFIVHAVVQGKIDNKDVLYKVELEVGFNLNNTNKLAIGNGVFTEVK